MSHALEAALAIETSTTLLARVKTLDPEAWKRFVSLYGPLVYRWCHRAGLQDADAADAGQEVFQAVFRAIGEFERTAGAASFRRWLKTITINKCRDFARRVRPGTQGDGGSDAYRALQQVAEDGVDELDDADRAGDEALLLRRAVWLVLSDLSQDARQAFLRVTGEGHAPREVAQELGMTVNAIYLIVSRVKRRIREEFAGLVAE